MDKTLEHRKQFFQAVLNSQLSPEETDELSSLISRDIKEPAAGNPGLIYHRPKDTIRFLYQFSRDPFFKWFTHDPDTNDNSIDYIYNYDVAEDRLGKATRNLNLNIRTVSHVKNFICDTEFPPVDGLGNHITISWRDAVEWLKNNPTINPFENYKVNGYKFRIFVSLFKNAIEFRTDNYDMLFSARLTDLLFHRCDLSEDILEMLDIDDSVYTIGGDFHTFTDVNLLFSSIKQLFAWVEQNRSISRTVFVGLKSYDLYYELEIFHKGSRLKIDGTKIKGLDGDFQKTRANLFCIADWSIEADREIDGIETSIRIDCLTENTTALIENKSLNLSANTVSLLNQKIGGVRHIIKIYKNLE